MPQIRKGQRACHDCGLEAIDDCESEKRHIPSDENLMPCFACVRNHAERHAPMRSDFWDEQWTRKADKSLIIQDTNAHQRQLLQTMHEIIQKEYERLPQPCTGR